LRDLYGYCYEVIAVLFVGSLLVALPRTLEDEAILDASSNYYIPLSPNSLVFQLGAQHGLNHAYLDSVVSIEAYSFKDILYFLTSAHPHSQDQIAKEPSLLVLVALPLNNEFLIVSHSWLDVNQLFGVLRKIPLPRTPATLGPADRPAPPAAPAVPYFILGNMHTTAVAFLALDLTLRRLALADQANNLLVYLQ
jgi:hypothetical protein